MASTENPAEAVTEPTVAPEVTEPTADSDKVDVAEDVTMDETEEAKRLRAARQIEFYFADSNLPYDKFMWTLHTANPEHWVPMPTVASFKRMREFTSLGMEWLVKALRELSDELEVDESGEKVRRKTEVKEPKGQFERSIYAKGFGEEVPGLQKKLETFFDQYGRTNAVRMRRIDTTREFKGSVFVEFDSMSSVEKFLAADPKPSWEGKELLIMSKEAYCEMKIKEKGLTGKAAINRKESMAGPTRKGFNAFKEMAGGDKRGKKGKEKVEKEVWLEFLGSRIRVYDEDGGTVKKEDIPFVKGATLKWEGCEDVSFDEIKAPLKERFGRPPFVKYSKGDNWGLVGFDKALSEEDVTYIKEHINTLSSKEVTWTVPDEETEKEFEIERATSAAKRALSFSQRNDSGGRGGRGGRGGGRGGRGRGRGGGGRGDGRDHRDRSGADAGNEDTNGGEKRKRGIEPDGGPHTGVRGAAVPAIQSSKKQKTEGDS